MPTLPNQQKLPARFKSDYHREVRRTDDVMRVRRIVCLTGNNVEPLGFKDNLSAGNEGREDCISKAGSAFCH